MQMCVCRCVCVSVFVCSLQTHQVRRGRPRLASAERQGTRAGLRPPISCGLPPWLAAPPLPLAGSVAGGWDWTPQAPHYWPARSCRAVVGSGPSGSRLGAAGSPFSHSVAAQMNTPGHQQQDESIHFTKTASYSVIHRKQVEILSQDLCNVKFWVLIFFMLT